MRAPARPPARRARCARRRRRPRLLLLLLLDALLVPLAQHAPILLPRPAAAAPSPTPPRFRAPHVPPHFTATLSIRSHLITPALQSDEGYPPAARTLRVSYDRDARAARVDEGDVAFVRRFDLRREYRIDAGPYPSCKRSFLAEPLPHQQFPRGGAWLAHEDAAAGGTPCPAPHAGRLCRVWRLDEGAGQVATVYVELESWVPLVCELTGPLTGGGDSPGETGRQRLLTFTFLRIDLERPDPALFALPAPTDGGRDGCEEQAGGWPWMHLFHHYLRV